MNELLKGLISNPAILGQMAEKTGLDASSVGGAVAKLAPVLMGQAKKNFDSDADSGNLLDMISKSDLDALASDPSALTDVNVGNQILGELTGSKEQSRSLASNVASSLGVDSSSITKLLPMVAPLVMGMLNKQTAGASSSDTNSLTSMLSSFIDQDNDGSIADDLMGMVASKFF